MSTSGIIEDSGVQIDIKQVRQQARIAMVNADEVTTETLHVEVREFVDEPVLRNDGTPLLDKQGKSRMYRKFAGTRTAHILNHVPIDIYAEGTALQGSGVGTQAGKEQINMMGDIVWKIWIISEPWMEKDELLRGGIDGEKVIELFTLFFDRMNRPLSDKA